MRKLVDRIIRAVSRAGGRYGPDRCPQMAAAISYHTFFSLFPLAIFLVAIFGIVMQDDERRQEVTDWLLDVLPLSEAAGTDLEKTIDGLASPFSAAGFIAVVGLLWSASGLMGAIRVSLTAIWGSERSRPYFRGKLLDFALVVLAGVLVLVAFGTTVAIRVVKRVSEDAEDDLGAFGSVVSVAGEATEVLIPLAVAFVTFLLIYRRVPPHHPDWRDLWPGALIAAIGFEAITTGFAYYLAYFADYNVVYGSLGAVVGFLFYVYLAASTFLFGAELAAAWPHTREPGEPSDQPWQQRLLGTARGLFVHRDERSRDGKTRGG